MSRIGTPLGRIAGGLTACLLLVGAWPESLALAAGSGLDEQPVVRRQLMLRGSRHELTLDLGGTLADAFTRNWMLGGSYQYYFDNWIGAGLSVQGNLCSVLGEACKTSLTEDIAASNPRVGSLDEVSAFTLATTAYLTVVPMSGKVGLFKKVFHYDTHLVAGVTMVKVGSLGGGGELDDTSFGPAIGVGQRFFLSDSLAVTLSLRDLILSRVLNAAEGGASTEAEYGNNFILSLGVSFYLPGQVETSR